MDSFLTWAANLNAETSLEIRTIRQFLAPQDRTLQILVSDRMGTRGIRDEFTCEWFQKHLLDFARSKDDVLAINGPSGCGKSTLAGWIVERLQRPLGRKSYGTITYFIGMLSILICGPESSINRDYRRRCAESDNVFESYQRSSSTAARTKRWRSFSLQILGNGL